jgi:hypothetical protein
VGDERRLLADHERGELHEQLEAVLVERHRVVRARVLRLCVGATFVVVAVGEAEPAAGEGQDEEGEQAEHRGYYRV